MGGGDSTDAVLGGEEGVGGKHRRTEHGLASESRGWDVDGLVGGGKTKRQRFVLN